MNAFSHYNFNDLSRQLPAQNSNPKGVILQQRADCWVPTGHFITLKLNNEWYLQIKKISLNVYNDSFVGTQKMVPCGPIDDVEIAFYSTTTSLTATLMGKNWGKMHQRFSRWNF